ncbi:hypothetical protein [[Mycoplasma] testudinis]|uniref:hypothetical protein n=1 Tax=[Mycoplasma] testudinis TaxID=33924 RepID=UPI000487BACC|nr:hypothetical protein [[Mycoplasma] testudinis]
MPQIKTSPIIYSIPMYQFSKIQSLIFNIVFKLFHNYYYDTLDYWFEFIKGIATSHEFIDGNKRTALLSFNKLIVSMGYYIKWSSDADNYVSYGQEFMVNMAWSDWNDESKKEYFKLIIMDNVWLSLS